MVSITTSGIARTLPLLGHSMGILRLYELPCEVQKLIGGSGSVLRPYTIVKCQSLTANSCNMSETRNSVLYIAIVRRSISRTV